MARRAALDDSIGCGAAHPGRMRPLVTSLPRVMMHAQCQTCGVLTPYSAFLPVTARAPMMTRGEVATALGETGGRVAGGGEHRGPDLLEDADNGCVHVAATRHVPRRVHYYEGPVL